GEFGINANVTTNGEAITPFFNIYRSVNNGDFVIINNGLSINDNQFIDGALESENEYCYQVTSVYNGNEGDPAAPVCAIPGVLNVSYQAENIPNHFELKQNYPNPFNPYTTIEFSLISDGYVQISIYDLNGRKVLDIIDDYIEFGIHSITIDSKGLSSGMYFYSFQVRDSDKNPVFYTTKKMALIK
ncbi:MAG: T9SS type A sorting domain-containing protein, partial [Candidatus Neomarinimicrobiota bacterium]